MVFHLRNIQIFVLAFVFLVCGNIQARTNTGYPEEIFFHSLTNNDGLSQGTINCIAQDNQGFIWIATDDGLNRYDGYNIRVYRNVFGDKNTISSSQIQQLLFDKNNKLWIVAGNKLNCFNPKTDAFTVITNDILKPGMDVTKIAADGTNLYIGTKRSGLFALQLNTDELSRFASPGIEDIPDKSNITHLFVSQSGKLWIAFKTGEIGFIKTPNQQPSYIPVTIEGLTNTRKEFIITGFAEDSNQKLFISVYDHSLFYLDETGLNFKSLRNEFPKGQEPYYDINCIIFQNDSLLWAGTDAIGITRINLNSRKLDHFLESPEKGGLLYHNIRTIFSDKDQNLWIGTYGKGLNIFSPNESKFLKFNTAQKGYQQLGFTSVRSILQLNDSILYCGGYHGLQKIDIKNRKSEFLFPNKIAYCLMYDSGSPDTLWIGTEGQGIFLMDIKTNKFTPLRCKEGSDNGQFKRVDPKGHIRQIVTVDENIILFGSTNGMLLYDKKQKTVKEFFNKPDDPTSIIPGFINSIYPDKENTIWVASGDGYLAKFDKENETFQSIDFGNYNNYINAIITIHEDRAGGFWLGTNAGLINYDRKTGNIRLYTVSDGLSNNVIYGILEDKSGNLWLSTNMGISRFNPREVSFINFTVNDGLPANEFNNAAWFQYNESMLYFGSVNGMVLIEPEKVRLSQPITEVAIADLKIIGNQITNKNQVSYNNSLVLEPDQKILMMDFSALQFFASGQTTYDFKLLDEMDQFAHLDKGRTLTLTLPGPGNYLLEVKARNNYGQTTANPLQLQIELMPFFYQTAWFKILIILLIASAMVTIYIARIKIIQQQNMRLEQLVDERTKQLNHSNAELQSANETKDKFFSIIAHDLKNPFNSLLGFTDLLINDWKELAEEEKIEFISIIKNTTEETFRLLMNLLEWSSIQRKRVSFNTEKVLIEEIIRETKKHLDPYAFFKNIRISIRDIPAGLTVEADPNMLMTVFRNLVSNAIKFTPKNGNITITARQENDNIVFCVEDSGIGMTKEVTDNLFKLRLNSPGKGTDGESGTGLGLILCQEFIKMHHGDIWAESEPGKGSRFCFMLPKKHIKQ
jgi:signal transduction histidine kinase/streptogramin lyase